MAWFAALTPLLTGAGTVASTGIAIAQAQNAKKIGELNARQAEASAKADADQSAREEEALRRQTTSILGKQRAAAAEAGVGVGGTTGLLVDQSAVLAELDALNVRYQGAVRGTGLLSDAATARFSGKSQAGAYGLMAGAELLRGSGDYSRAKRLAQE
jgi:hypothetical protein